MPQFHDRVVTLRLPAPPTDVDLTNDGSRIAVAVASPPGVPAVLVYDTATGDQVAEHARSAGFGRGVVFGREQLYAVVEDASTAAAELHRLPAGGSAERLASFGYGGGLLVRNRDSDLLAFLHTEVTVFHDDANGAAPRLVRVIRGMAGRRTVHAGFPAEGPYLFCSGVVAGHLVRWDLGANLESGRWEAPGESGTVVVSPTGRYCLTTGHGISPSTLVDTAEGSSRVFDERSGLRGAAFTLAEDGLVHSAGRGAAYHPLTGGDPASGPDLTCGWVDSVHRAWDAGVFAFVHDGGLCLVRSPGAS